MGFSPLLGNEQLKQNLKNSLYNRHISHFYLISGPKGSGKHTLAKLLAAAILCGSTDAPCLKCHACRKVMENMHPDVITVDDPDKKTVSVELIRQARSDIYIRPNESDYKIYLFPRAQDMGIPGQNALLKVLEEPPKYGVFLLLTDNPERLLPTVRSRCTELNLHGLPKEILLPALRKEFPDTDEKVLEAACLRSGGYLGQAKALIQEGLSVPEQTQQLVEAFSARSPMGLTQVLVPMEKWKRDQLIPMLDGWKLLFAEALVCRSGGTSLSPLAQQLARSRSPQDLFAAVQHLEKAALYAQSNVSPAAVCGYLSWALR